MRSVQFLNGCWYAVYTGEHSSGSLGETRCSCIAASAVTGLNVEPGGYDALIARLMPGWFSCSATVGSRSGASFVRSLCPTKIDGWYVGYEAIARIAPFRGSIATIAPPLACEYAA